MRNWLIAYDVGRSGARNAIAVRLEREGRRIQKSVFIVECGEAALLRLERELQELLTEEDSLLIVPICEQCLAKARIYGRLPVLFLMCSSEK